jgi:hypothetical protein
VSLQLWDADSQALHFGPLHSCWQLANVLAQSASQRVLVLTHVEQSRASAAASTLSASAVSASTLSASALSARPASATTRGSPPTTSVHAKMEPFATATRIAARIKIDPFQVGMHTPSTMQEPCGSTDLRYVLRVTDRDIEGETKKQRVDRELNELLGELRIALPGVQMLFAFLLTVPFYARFETLPRLLRTVFFLTFTSTTIAAAFLIAPSSNHRLSFRAQDKEHLLLRANGFAIAGIAFLALSICGAMFLIAGTVLGVEWAPVATGAVGVLLGVTWYLMPLARKIRNRHDA